MRRSLNSPLTRAVSTEFPASVSTNSVLTVSRNLKFGPGVPESNTSPEKQNYRFEVWTRELFLSPFGYCCFKEVLKEQGDFEKIMKT